jgi:glycosyltransferase involved in cell wall biosynthesis
MERSVSVLMSCYNSEPYLVEAIESIINQTVKDFEFIIINDGSTDKSLEIIKSFNDDRIRIIDNKANLGLIKSLNIGISECKGEYIVRMDADDISEKNRIEILKGFMDMNPDIGACSSYFEFGINSNKIIEYPLSHEAIYLNCLNSCPFGHAPSILRRSVLLKNNLYYDERFLHSEDSNLWIRMLNLTRFANIPQMLYKVRLHQESITQKYPQQVNFSFNKSRNIHFSNISTKLNESVTVLPFPEGEIYYAHIEKFESNIFRLFDKNRVIKVFDEPLFEKCLGKLWLEIVNKAQGLTLNNLFHIIRSPLIIFSGIPYKYRLILFKKWIMKYFKQIRFQF